MRKEAEMHADEDKSKKEAVEVRINAESLVSQTERTLKDAGDKVDAATKEPVEAKLKELKEMLESSEADTELIKQKTDALSEEIQKIGAQMYQAAGAAEGADDDDGVKVKDVSEEAEKKASWTAKKLRKKNLNPIQMKIRPVEYAILCDHASLTVDGKLNLNGIF